MQHVDPGVLARAAGEALQRRDFARARALFSALTETRPQDANAWYGLAAALGELGDAAARLEALDRAISLNAAHLPALLMKADHYAAAGDPRSAHAFYDQVVRQARSLGALPPAMSAEVRRAESAAHSLAAAFESEIARALSGTAYAQGNATPRLAQAVDLLLGRRQLYLQAPQSLFFPELPHRQFFEREEFAWAAALEAQTEAIRHEFVSLPREGDLFEPYVRTDPRRPPTAFGNLTDNPDWSAVYLVRSGEATEAGRRFCPRTLAALQQAPLCTAPGRTPSILFSVLRPGTVIPPHNGQINCRLICHLPLVVPPGCALRVGNETRTWREGELLIFDDTIEHEAWNRSDQLRIVLIFEIWRPELMEVEREVVSALLASVASFDANG